MLKIQSTFSRSSSSLSKKLVFFKFKFSRKTQVFEVQIGALFCRNYFKNLGVSNYQLS